MRIGEFYIGNHQHKDFGTFQIYFRGPLAIASGVYQGSENSWYAKPHWTNYYQQTVSKNGLLIRDPGEQQLLSSKAANDGGQLWPNAGNNHPKTIRELTKPENGYRMGEVTAHAIGPGDSYAYIEGDITHAYSAKVKRVTRAMLAVRTGDERVPMVFAVRDTIESAQPGFERVFLLHSTDKPAVEGRRVTIVNTRATLTQDRGVFSGQYGGQLVLECLSPKGADIRIVEGHMVDGVSFQATKPEANGEEGWGRVEIADAGTEATEFLNVMTVMDAGEAPPPVTELADGFAVLNVAVFFQSAAFAFELPAGGPYDLHVCGIEDGSWVLAGTSISAVSEGRCLKIEKLEPGSYDLQRG
jgi:heparin/heparan-sulfate lyase